MQPPPQPCPLLLHANIRDHAVEQQAGAFEQIRILPVIRTRIKIAAPGVEQPDAFFSARRLRRMHGDRVAAVLFQQSHARHVGVAVAEIDHVGKRNGPRVFRHVAVDALAQILDALVDAEQVLRLAGVGDDALRKRQIISVEPIFRREHVGEVLVDLGALDDLGQARRHQIMFERDAVARAFLFHISRDVGEPRFDTGVQLNIAPLRHQILAIDAQVLLLGLLVHQVHVGDQRIGALSLGNARTLGPEILGLDAELRQKRIFLHRLRGERAIEIVDQRDRLLGVRGFLLFEAGARRGERISLASPPVWRSFAARPDIRSTMALPSAQSARLVAAA